MKDMKRAIHFDFHTMPGIADFGKNFDADAFARQMEEAHVDYVNVAARCNIGYSYYPTQVGEPYPTMQGNFCGDIVTALKKRGIGVTLYINGGLNHMLMAKEPGIMKINKDGTVYDRPQENMNFFRTPCFNSTYRTHLLAEIREMVQMNPDGIFVDCLIPKSCYCPRCMEKMRALGIDTQDDNAVYNYALSVLREVFAEIRAAVPQDKRLYLNSYPYDEIHNLVSHSELECLPSGGWGYDFIAAMAPYQRMFTKDKVYMTGCFTGGWGDFGGKKSKAAIEHDVYDALLYGYHPSVGDHMHPRDGVNTRLYKEIGEIYRFVEALEPWTENAEPVCDTAILRNKCTNGNVPSSLPDSAKGAARMLSELKVCFNIINADMDFDGYKLLVLPEDIEITGALQQKLCAFSGSILSCGKSCSQGGVWDYFEFEEDFATDSYYVFNNEVFGQYAPCLKLKSAFSFADYVDSYFNRHFDGTHAYFYNPPKDKTDFCAVALKNNRAHIGFNAFTAYFNYGALHIKDLIRDILNILLPNPLVRANEMPSYTRVTRMQTQAGDTLVHIKTTVPEHRGNMGIVEDHMPLPQGTPLSVLGTFKTAKLLPSLTQVPCTASNGYTTLSLPPITGYAAILLTE